MQAQQMNEKQWSIAHDLASDLVDYGTDPNEFGKVAAFMRRYQKADNAKNQLMLLLQRLANSNNAPIRSGKTQEYYQDIQESCQKHLSSISEPDELMLILGWCMRLMRYYRVEPKRAAEAQRRPRQTEGQQKRLQQQHQEQKPQPTRTPKPPKQPEKPKFKVGDKVNATILKKDGSKVTVRLQTDGNAELVFERLHYPPHVGEKIKVRVQGVDGTGKVSKVIP
jgi:hypothetical protein